MSQGTLRLGSASALGTSSLVTVGSGATLDVAGRAAGRPVAISGTGVSGFALYNSSTTSGASVGSLRLNDNATVASAVPGANTGTLFGTGSLDLNGKTLTLSGGAFTAGIRDITSGNIMINSGATFYSQNGGTQTSVTGTITINSGGVMDTRDLDNTAMSSVHTIALNGGQLGRGQVAGNNGGGAGTILKNNITVDAVNGGSILNTSSGGFGINYRLAGSITGSGPLTLGGGVGVEFQGDTSGYTGTATGTGGTITFNPTIATQTFGGILAGSRPVVKNGVNTTIFAGAHTYTGATTISAGTLVLAGANTGNSAFTVGSGATLKLDYATQDNGKLHDSSVLTLSGGTVDLSSATGSHTEAVASLTLTANTANSITRTGANTAVLALNTITRGANATLNFGAGGIATTDSLNSNGILGTWATIGGTDFAVNSTNGADGLITAPSYDLTSVALDTAASYTDRHMSVDSSQTLGGAITPFTLSYKSAGAHTLTLTGTNTIKAGGILISSEVGNNASSLVGGIVQTGTAGGDLRIVQNNTASTLTIGSVIQNNTSARTLTKSGAGTLILAGVNTYTGATNIAAGTLRFGNANAIATSGLVMTGGTVDLAGFNANILGLRSDVASAGTITNSAAGTGTNTLSITGGWWGSYSGVIQNGATARTGLIVSGTNARFSLSGTNTFTGGLTINGAGNTDGADSGVILGIASDAALGATSNVLTLNNGGTLFNANSSTGGWSTGSSPTLAAGRSIVLGTGSGGVFRVWGATTFTVNSVISGSGALAKTDGGILALGGTNTYTGVTTVSAGTIRMDNAQAFGNYISGRPVTQVVVASGGAVDLNARGSTYGYTIAGTGVGGTGALVNTGAAISNGSAQTSNLKLSANATIGGAGNWALLTNSFAATSLDLSGFTLTKAGANTIALVSATTTAGAISVSSGTLAFGVSNGGSGVVGAASSLSLADTAGVSLSLARDSSIGSLAGGGVTGGGVALGSSTLTLGALNSNTSYAGVVSGTGAIVKTGTGTQTFSGANTYSGSTTVNGGTLALDYATQNNTKLSDTAALTFGAGSGTLSLAGGSHTEVVASTTLSAGALVNITRPSGTSVIQLGTLSVGANSTLNLSAGGIATTNNLNNANGILGSWATVGTDWAQSAASGTNIPITAYTGYANYSRLSSGTKVIANNAADNARIQEGTGTAASLTLAAATTNLNTLNQSATGGATTVLLSGANNTLRLGTAGGILAGPGVSALTIGSAVNEGFLSAGGSTTATAGTLQITNNSSNTVTINSAVINNGSGAVTLVKSGSGLVTLAGNTGGTYSGGTIINQGELRVSTPNTAGTYTTLGTGAVTVNSGTTLRFATGSHSNNLTFGNALNLNNATLINEDGNHILTNTVALTGANTINGIYSGKNLTLSGVVSGAGSLTKTGSASLILSNINTYTGGTTVTGGILTLGNGGANGAIRGTVTVNSGTTLNYSAQNAFGYNTGTSVNVLNIIGGTVGNAGFSNHFWNNFQLNMTAGTLNLGVGTGGTTNEWQSPTITTNASANTATIAAIDAAAVMRLRDNTHATFNVADGAAAVDVSVTAAITQSGGVSNITKTGAGLMQISGVNAYTGTTTISGGTLRISGAGSLNSGNYAATITNNGTLEFTSSATQTLGGNIGGTGSITKSTGTGTLTLGGSNTYTGATIISSGRLTLTGTNASSLTINSGATLTSRGSTTGGLVTNTGSTIALNGTVPVTGLAAGAVNFAGTTALAFDALPALGSTTHTVVSYSSVAGVGNLSMPAGYRGSIFNNTGASRVELNITTGTRTWNMSSPGTWNILTNPSWVEGDNTFATGDAVVFDDTASNGAVTLAGTLVPGSLAFNNTTTSYALTGSGVIAGTTGLTKNGSGTASIATNNTYAGATAINAGSLNIQHANALGATTAGTTVASGAALEIQGGITTAAEALTLNGTGVTSTSGALRNVSGNNTYAGAISLATASTIYSETGTTLTTSGQFTLANTLTKTGGGTLRLTSYSGSTAAAASDIVINGGTVEFGSAYFNASPFGYRALAITVNSGGILRTSASHALGGDNVDAGTSFGQIVANGGTIQFDGSQYVSAGTVSGQGRIVLTGGTITGSGDMRMLGSTISTAASATTSTISGSGGINLGFGGVTFDVAEGAAAVDLQVSAVISSTNGVIKSGAGLAAFSGTNTYTGATTVSQGTLLINGSTAAGSTVGVAAGATLGGTGTIGGAVNVTGVLSPGASIETLGTGTLSFANGSTLVHELDSSVSPTVGSDLVKVTGNLNLAGTVGISLSDLAVTDVAFNINDVFSLINYTGTWNGGLFTLGGNELADDEVFIFGLNNWKISYDDLAGGLNYSGEHASGSSFVNLTVVPEPRAALLGGLGLLLLLRRRR